MKNLSGGGAFLIRVLAVIIACLGLASFYRAVSILNGEVIERTYRARALPAFQETFGSVPTSVLCVLVGASLMVVAFKFWRSGQR